MPAHWIGKKPRDAREALDRARSAWLKTAMQLEFDYEGSTTMPQQTIVTLVDDDNDEFPIALPGIFKGNREADIESALQIAREAIRDGGFRPNGELRFERIEFVE